MLKAYWHFRKRYVQRERPDRGARRGLSARPARRAPRARAPPGPHGPRGRAAGPPPPLRFLCHLVVNLKRLNKYKTAGGVAPSLIFEYSCTPHRDGLCASSSGSGGAPVTRPLSRAGDAILTIGELGELREVVGRPSWTSASRWLNRPGSTCRLVRRPNPCADIRHSSRERAMKRGPLSKSSLPDLALWVRAKLQRPRAAGRPLPCHSSSSSSSSSSPPKAL